MVDGGYTAGMETESVMHSNEGTIVQPKPLQTFSRTGTVKLS